MKWERKGVAKGIWVFCDPDIKGEISVHYEWIAEGILIHQKQMTGCHVRAEMRATSLTRHLT